VQSPGYELFSDSGFPEQEHWNIHLSDAVNLLAQFFHRGTARKSQFFWRRERQGRPCRSLLEGNYAG